MRVWYVLQCPHLIDMFRMSIESLIRGTPPFGINIMPSLVHDLHLSADAMRRGHLLHRLLPLLVLALMVRPGLAQEPEASATFEEEVSVGYVLVPLVVRSGAGYADRLDQDDFRLLVDGKPVKIDSFERRADAPASVVFLQDLSGSMEGTSLD